VLTARHASSRAGATALSCRGVPNPLAPLTFMPRIALRALDDLHQIAGATRRVPAQLDALLEQAEEATGLLLRIESLGRELLVLGARIDARGEELVSTGERMDLLAESVLMQGRAIEGAAREVAARGAQVVEALPTLQRAVELAEPLEGVVERVGRLADRLPGGRRVSTHVTQAADADEGPMPRGTA
jgi:hypothetical protein